MRALGYLAAGELDRAKHHPDVVLRVRGDSIISACSKVSLTRPQVAGFALNPFVEQIAVIAFHYCRVKHNNAQASATDSTTPSNTLNLPGAFKPVTTVFIIFTLNKAMQA